MSRKCEVCGSSNINLRYSVSSILWGEKYLCSYSCQCAAFRYHSLFGGFIIVFILIVMTSLDLTTILFVGVPVLLYLFGKAIYGFNITSVRDSSHKEAHCSCVICSATDDQTLIRIKRFNRFLRKNQNQSHQDLSNTLVTSVIVDPDPLGFFDVSTGELKYNTLDRTS